MEIITILICFLFAFLAFVLQKTYLNPQTLFCGFIGFIVFLASFRLFGLSESSTLTYIIIDLGIFFFTLGSMLASRIRNTTFSLSTNGKTQRYNGNEITYTLNSKLIFYLSIFLLMFSVYRMVTTVIPLLIRGYSLDMVRLVYFGTEFQEYSYGHLDSILEMFINLPFLYALIPVLAIEITSDKDHRKLGKTTIIILFIWIILSCIISGGRALIYNLAVAIIAAWLFSRKSIEQKITKKKRIQRNIVVIASIGIIIFLMYQLSIHRSNNTAYEFAYQLYVYFCGCIPHTSLRLETVDIKYTYGFTLISGFLRPIMLFYKYTFGNGNFPEIYQRTLDIGTTLQSAIRISSGHTFNAFVLPFYYFYVDGGLLGVTIDSFIYGFFCSRPFYRFNKTSSMKDEATYLLIIILIATSMIRYNLSLVYFAFAYIYINFLFKKQNI